MTRNKYVATIIKVFFPLIIIIFLYWAFSNNMFNTLFEHPSTFVKLLKEHITLILISGGAAIFTSIPLGILLTRPKFRKVEWLAVNVANLGQTIPSLAVLAIAASVLGIGVMAAIFALYIYSLLPILQNTIAGIDSVNPKTKDAARGIGLTPLQILWKIELPNATNSIIAGVRTAIVINIGTAALAFLIGGGGLGIWIFTGIQMFDNSYLISGAVPVTLLAISVDYLLKISQYLLVPKGLRLAREALQNN